MEDGKLRIPREGAVRKFLENVEQQIFSAEHAGKLDRKVRFVTERAGPALLPAGLTATEIAPGIDFEKNVLDRMDFRPHATGDIRLMGWTPFAPFARQGDASASAPSASGSSPHRLFPLKQTHVLADIDKGYLLRIWHSWIRT